MTENEAIERVRYRIDTATDIAGKGSDGKAYEDMEMAIKALEEIQQYRSIGTVEKFRAAVEKQRAKKPIRISPCKSVICYECPSCGKYLSIDKTFCEECGKAIDWSDTQ